MSAQVVASGVYGRPGLTVAELRATEAQAAEVGRARAAPLPYRPDIDGLRALAVLPVVLFHLKVQWVRGGFIGVDVFFVISGYLITKILWADIETRRFSLLRFYDRRVRRIFPALFAAMASATILALCMLFPPELVGFARSVSAATLFVSNMYFMAVTDYFNSFTDTDPLLHTWSLAVEEQFYIVFPLLLLAFRRAPKRVLLASLGGLGLASLVLSAQLVQTNQIAAFYLAPSRAWELLVGAALALEAVPTLRARWLRESVAAVGILLITGGVLRFHQAMPFPGLLALVPCFGAACLIHAGAGGPTVVGRLLSTRPAVFVGLISYSLYIWHWPLFVYARLWSVAPLEGSGKLASLCLSLVVAVLSWRYIELPFRDRTVLAASLRLRGAALAAMALALIVAGGLWAGRGFAVLSPPSVMRLVAYLNYDDRPVYRQGRCFLDSHTDALSAYDFTLCQARRPGHRSLLLIGDSHAAHLWHGLASLLPDTDVLQATATGCKPVFGGKGAPTCLALIGRTLDAVETAGGDRVILSARWEAADIPAILLTVDRLAPHVKSLYLSGPIVEYNEALPRLLASAQTRGEDWPVRAGRLPDQDVTDRLLRAALQGHAANYLSPYQALCGSASAPCLTQAAGGVPVQWDYGHLTAEGSAAVVRAWISNGALDAP